jgi:hypothetical protein
MIMSLCDLSYTETECNAQTFLSNKAYFIKKLIAIYHGMSSGKKRRTAESVSALLMINLARAQPSEVEEFSPILLQK